MVLVLNSFILHMATAASLLGLRSRLTLGDWHAVKSRTDTRSQGAACGLHPPPGPRSAHHHIQQPGMPGPRVMLRLPKDSQSISEKL